MAATTEGKWKEVANSVSRKYNGKLAGVGGTDLYFAMKSDQKANDFAYALYDFDADNLKKTSRPGGGVTLAVPNTKKNKKALSRLGKSLGVD